VVLSDPRRPSLESIRRKTVDSLEETFRKFKEESERIGRAFAAGVIGSGEYDSLMLVMIGRFQADLIVGYGIGMSYDD
jgi:hypothetical protein